MLSLYFRGFSGVCQEQTANLGRFLCKKYFRTAGANILKEKKEMSTVQTEMKEITDGRFDYAALMQGVRILSDRYPFLQFSYLTESVMGKGIPILRLGEGEKELYYIGTHHGAERITGALLLRFLCEFCTLAEGGHAIFGMNLAYILKSRSLFFIPVLNVDGADIAANGAPRDSLLYARLVGMNGSEDFTHWQANARGVDLNHNYDAGFAEYKRLEPTLGITGGGPTRFSGEAPESEPETGALCNYLRFNHPTAVLTLHTQGQEIYYTSGDRCPPRAVAAAQRLAKCTGYTLAAPEGAAAYGGLTDFCIQKLGIPAFTFECGKGKTPLPQSDLPLLYAETREALFTFPSMF